MSCWKGRAPQVVERLRALILEFRRDLPLDWGHGSPEAEGEPLRPLWEEATSWGMIWAQRNGEAILAFEAVNVSLQGDPAWL